jgi:hypothetical protein
LQEEFHLLHDAAPDDLIILVELERQTATQQHLFLDVALDQTCECRRIGRRAELQRVAKPEMCFPLWSDDDSRSIRVTAVRLAGDEQHQARSDEMQERLAQASPNESSHVVRAPRPW